MQNSCKCPVKKPRNDRGDRNERNDRGDRNNGRNDRNNGRPERTNDRGGDRNDRNNDRGDGRNERQQHHCDICDKKFKGAQNAITAISHSIDKINFPRFVSSFSGVIIGKFVAELKEDDFLVVNISIFPKLFCSSSRKICFVSPTVRPESIFPEMCKE